MAMKALTPPTRDKLVEFLHSPLNTVHMLPLTAPLPPGFRRNRITGAVLTLHQKQPETLKAPSDDNKRKSGCAKQKKNSGTSKKKPAESKKSSRPSNKNSKGRGRPKKKPEQDLRDFIKNTSPNRWSTPTPKPKSGSSVWSRLD